MRRTLRLPNHLNNAQVIHSFYYICKDRSRMWEEEERMPFWLRCQKAKGGAHPLHGRIKKCRHLLSYLKHQRVTVLERKWFMSVVNEGNLLSVSVLKWSHFRGWERMLLPSHHSQSGLWERERWRSLRRAAPCEWLTELAPGYYCLPLYAVACWTFDGRCMGDAQESRWGGAAGWDA